MNDHARARPPLEVWGGIECTVNRVRNRYFDQSARTGHDSRPGDLDKFAALGITALRYPVLWERIAPAAADAPDWRWTDERLHRIRELGMRPIAGLVHHGSGPRYTSLLDDEFPVKLAAYARRVAERYPWVTDYTPVNEPLTTARFSALYGHWYPHGHGAQTFVRALLAQLRGTVLAMRAIRAVNPAARLIQTDDCGQTFGTPATATQVAHEEHRRWLTWDLLTGRVGADHPLRRYLLASGASDADLAFFTEDPCPPDVIGLNYYVTSDRFLDDRLDRHPASARGGNGRIRYADVEAVRVRDEGLVGHQRHLLNAWLRYQLPVAMTEVHLACTREEQLRWLVESWHGAQRARASGADVRAITAWALLGAYDWHNLVTRQDDRYETGTFDVRGSTPRPTILVRAIADMAAGREPSHPVLAAPGWWARSHRASQVHTTDAQAARRPILVLGAAGTLGQAFSRVCASRGLALATATRRDVDIADPNALDAILDRVQPWAVINAAGYVRVDLAEREPAECSRANVTGPLQVAAACARARVPLVTFSSDLVFDGQAGRPYVESDTPRPLNVYGCSKAESEAAVLAQLPDALVIRTSAFFGPWDEHNFIAHMLREIGAGRQFRAAADSVVSPTYVPDLVHAALDLLIDGENGLWHLANAGEVSWFDFAKRVAAQCDFAAELVVPAATVDVWGPATRPRNSALASERGAMMRSLDEAVEAYVAETGARLLGDRARTLAS